MAFVPPPDYGAPDKGGNIITENGTMTHGIFYAQAKHLETFRSFGWRKLWSIEQASDMIVIERHQHEIPQPTVRDN